MADSLLPCPFCGSTKIFTEPDEYGSGGQWVMPIHVGCSDCGAEQQCEDIDDVAAIWNRRAALASRPAEVDDSQLRNVAQFLLDRYDELRNKKGAPSTAEFELLRLALAPSHTTNKEK